MYKALYRKWRPQVFDDVISQNHVTDTLKNQLKSGKTAHAYLFTGSRGTGKTTCARIFAKALCCLNNTDGNPCLECEICKEAELSKLSDIIEIDAASNNSVEDVRDLREGAIYLPERCKYKIYIIDEVHMLSNNAFNALLKIMEEPPEFVKFILATTEIHKVPATILSRCQRFDFKRINPEDISSRLEYIAKNEGIILSKEASSIIARLSDGGMRDAISLLDQCSSYSDNVTEEVISSSLGIAGREYLFDTLEYLCNKDIAKIFELLNNLYTQSKDLTVFCSDIIAQLRNVMILKIAPIQKENIACMPNEIDRLLKVTEKLSLDEILSYLDTLESTYNRLSKTSNKRTELEFSFANICSCDGVSHDVKHQMDNSGIYTQYGNLIENLVERINLLENKISSGKVVESNNSNVRINVSTPQQGNVEDSSQRKPIKVNKNDLKPLSQWQEVLSEFCKVNPSTWATLDGSTASICEKENLIIIYPKNDFFKELFKKDNNASTLRQIMDRTLGKQYRIMVGKSETSKETNNIVQNNGQDYTINNLVGRAKGLDIPTSVIE